MAKSFDAEAMAGRNMNDESSGEEMMRQLSRRDRANSDTNLTRISQQFRSSLTVDRTDYIIGSGAAILVTWDIHEEISATDWIGLFLTEETNHENYLDQRHRGGIGSRTGQLPWCIDDAEHQFHEPLTTVQFRYYNGASGALVALTSTINVYNTADKVTFLVRFFFWTQYSSTHKGTFTYQLTGLEVGRCQPKCQLNVSVGRYGRLKHFCQLTSVKNCRCPFFAQKP